jgi:ATP-dependent protease HslVU (ClpYQ) peptidase subunit
MANVIGKGGNQAQCGEGARRLYKKKLAREERRFAKTALRVGKELCHVEPRLYHGWVS